MFVVFYLLLGLAWALALLQVFVWGCMYETDKNEN